MQSEWQRVETEADVERLLATFGEFHDACLREVHLWTETFVREDLTLVLHSHLDTHLRVLFQRQWRNPSAIELWFDQVVDFHLTPSAENLDKSIVDAALLVRDGIIYWADSYDWRPDHEDRDALTWFAARQLRWRDASPWMGELLRYGPGSGG